MEENTTRKTNRKERPTIYEVAKVAGVSLATVSRVINNHSNVTEKREKQSRTQSSVLAISLLP